MIISNSDRDITYTPDGDFMVSPSADINLSGMEHYQLLAEALLKRLSSDAGDWNSNLAVSSDLGGILGSEASLLNSGLARALVQTSLTEFDLVSLQDISISPPIVDGSRVIFSLTINVEDSNEVSAMYFVYDTRDNSFQAKTITRD